MKTFSETRETFLEILMQLKQLEGPGRIIQAMRIVKEREVGKLCYQAEEDLLSHELSLLRDMLNMKKNTWEDCKEAYLRSFSPS